ncbi:uncharacterized protein SPSK_01243 [Sporothrix schenckii 1099-18]|uniref:Uncharacterized protein n=1 Tax=Sporothrix schenckii 1099-18 TaxID=1397361 RepID=A0A0F2LUY0_SPOSC|nr:uncharacterized protein SPSK_01243 [Sporothrix schenckii 1099-18]KJR81272.1 hypothetical protein SPSK_01243 [Sporothrix schenckii 1099-18]
MKSVLMMALGLMAITVNGQSYAYSETSQYGVQPTPPSSTSAAGPTLTSSYSYTAHPYPTVLPSTLPPLSSVTYSETQSVRPVQSTLESHQTSSSTYLPPPPTSSTTSKSLTSSSVWQPPPYGSVGTSALSSVPGSVSSSAQATYGTSPPPVYSTNCVHSSYAWNTTTAARSVASSVTGSTTTTTDCPPTSVTSTGSIIDNTTLPPYGGSGGGNRNGDGAETSSSSPVFSGQATGANRSSAMAILLMALAYGASFLM